MYIPIPGASGEPLYIRLYRAIREDCLSGVLRSGDRLPSRRSLARELHVSVNTVDGAYQQLVSEGYVEALPRSGYVVRPLFGDGAEGGEIAFSGPGKPDPSFPPGFSAFEKQDASPLPATPGQPGPIDFSPNGVDLSALPLSDLRKLTREVFALDPMMVFGPCEPEGHSLLRSALCRYLASSRGILCPPERIVVGAGTDYILQYLVRLLRLSGRIDGIATENPVYNKAVQIFSSMGESVTPLPIDGQGLRTEALRDCRANVAYVTPSHQFPLGIVMPAGRRAELLSWASASDDRYVIEDDYDSEFRYEGRPVPPLFAMSKSDKVIYLGTFSKSIAPSLRISYLVLPEHLASICRREMAFFNTTVSVPDQLVLARFIDSGLFERHINRMRTLYRRKKNLLVRELSGFGEALRISGTDAGLHLICTVRGGSSGLLQSGLLEKDLVAAAAAVGVRVYGISDYFLDRDSGERGKTGKTDSEFRIPEPTVLIGYGGLDPAALVRGCEWLKGAWSP
ncbi:MAG: PLP-dependent aminotransferase family protein [Oscillospiraceae bacterium]|nr:PLP-dependent aminotransferase family protein [Oscillospiraceae bacterium]